MLLLLMLLIVLLPGVRLLGRPLLAWDVSPLHMPMICPTALPCAFPLRSVSAPVMAWLSAHAL